MKRQSWVPTPAPMTPCYGSAFSNPIAEIECQGNESISEQETIQKPAKSESKSAGKKGPQYVAYLKEEWESKTAQLKVVTETSCRAHCKDLDLIVFCSAIEFLEDLV